MQPLARRTIADEIRPSELFPDTRPYVRWWWLRGPFRKTDVLMQLEWLKKEGFGGVEIAWLHPNWLRESQCPSPPASASPLEQTLFFNVRIPKALELLEVKNQQECPLKECSFRDYFRIFQEATAWQCSGCGAHGDVVELVAQVQGTDRAAAAGWLSAKAEVKHDPTDVPQADLGWLTPKFSEYINFTKMKAGQLGLGCDFTFGSIWPFGGNFLPPEHRSQNFSGPSHERVNGSWDGKWMYVLNHLSKEAFDYYASVLGPAFAPALGGRTSGLFCDSLEIEKDTLWSKELWEKFRQRFGYDLRGALSSINDCPHIRYDVRKLVGETILTNFYQHFTTISHQLGARSRVQCHGAPTDLLAAYAAADVPESESLLFDPWFSKIAASAATLEDRAVVSCETFTCLYGFPDGGYKEENVEDLKFLADSLFANGINQIIWHGMPYNPPGEKNYFYASVHVGPDCAFKEDLAHFNSYLQTVSSYMRLGHTLSGLAVYLPNEDMMMQGQLPKKLQTPGALDHWEMRHVQLPKETEGYLPTWISGSFLSECRVENRMLCYKERKFPGLYVDVTWLDREALSELLRLVQEGLPIILKRTPQQPGKMPSSSYEMQLGELCKHNNVFSTLEEARIAPIIEGKNLPYTWARVNKGSTYFFFAHPETRNIRYPLSYGQSSDANARSSLVRVQTPKGPQEIPLTFAKNRSQLIKISASGEIESIDLGF